MSKTTKSVGRFIGYILLLLVVIGAVGMIIRYANGDSALGGILGGGTDNTVFSVEYREQTVIESAVGIRLSVYEENLFKVKSGGGQRLYSVQIVPNGEFTFTTDGMPRLFSEQKNLTGAFDIDGYDGYFTIGAPVNMQAILQKLYPGKTVYIEDVLSPVVDYFTMIVTSQNGTDVVKIAFSLSTIGSIESITLSEDSIILW
jgi:hypothetical protein